MERGSNRNTWIGCPRGKPCSYEEGKGDEGEGEGVEEYDDDARIPDGGSKTGCVLYSKSLDYSSAGCTLFCLPWVDTPRALSLHTRRNRLSMIRLSWRPLSS